MRRGVIVVGSGLAGLSCTFELLRQNRDVLLLEKNDHLGGRTASWQADGMTVETALHRVPGFYTEFPEFLRAAGLDLDDVIVWTDRLEIRTPDGACGEYVASPHRHPLRTFATAVGNNDFLAPNQKLKFVRFMVAGLRDYFRNPERLDMIDIQSYAQQRGIDETTMQRIIEPLTTGLLFLKPSEYSAQVFFASFGAFMGGLIKSGMGNFTAPMGESMIGPIAERIRSMGATIQSGTEVESMIVQDGRVTGVRANGETHTAESVVLAADINAAKRLIRSSFTHTEAFAGMLALPQMSGVSIQFELSRPALPTDDVMFGPGTVMTSFSEQSRTTFKHVPGHLSVILAPAELFLDMPPAEVAEIVYRDAARIGIDFKDTVIRYRMVTEPWMFHAVSPGAQTLRPSQKTAVEGFYLAGDYTLMKYPPTMEGAVVSGRLAAEALLQDAEGQSSATD